ncbi:hypothetical protein DVA86_01360 [Streptomyces armeniacus]|uniref:Transcriptional regulator n=1 Tax=Streptomyces armeniacus TaxID=83291 RepID=A0A345XIM8_9ACTN|nr:hypothetical protein [Streptomyces armeniacus]AXK31494.1 hypothetical protein DVA86_01360 [Streptomyces armeniacus]
MRSASRTRTPNDALRALLEESGWTQAAFARALARLGAETGAHLHYDRTSVAHWLRGSRPGPAVQRLMAEALSRRLRRPVTVADLGMGGTGGPGRRPYGRTAAPPDWPDPRVRALDTLAALTAPAAGPSRAHAKTPAPYRLTLLTEPKSVPPEGKSVPPEGRTGPKGPAGPGGPAGNAALTGPEGVRGRPAPAQRAEHAQGAQPTERADCGPADVASVRAHAYFFAEQADRRGGGHIRAPLAAYVSGLARRLRDPEAAGPYRGELLSGAARLSYLLARVYADEQRHGLAQRAFLTSGELAEEAGDPAGSALARRALSTQAHELGHHRHSLALAEAACETAPPDTEPSARAFLYAGLAVAAADGGGRADALAALRRAEQSMAHADALGGGPVGGYQEAALQYQTGQVRAGLGDRSGAIRELRASLRSRPVDERRARALSHAELAELLLSCGRLEEACASWEVFLEDCSMVRSGRARRARARIPVLIRPYRREECAQALMARSGALAGNGGFQ